MHDKPFQAEELRRFEPSMFYKSPPYSSERPKRTPPKEKKVSEERKATTPAPESTLAQSKANYQAAKAHIARSETNALLTPREISGPS